MVFAVRKRFDGEAKPLRDAPAAPVPIPVPSATPDDTNGTAH